FGWIEFAPVTVEADGAIVDGQECRRLLVAEFELPDRAAVPANEVLHGQDTARVLGTAGIDVHIEVLDGLIQPFYGSRNRRIGDGLRVDPSAGVAVDDAVEVAAQDWHHACSISFRPSLSTDSAMLRRLP